MKNTKPLLLLALLPALSVAPAWSQPGGGPGGPPGGPGGGMGGMRGGPKGHIGRLMRGLERLDKENKTPLNQAQAKKIVAIVSPWHSKKSMTDDQAKAVLTSLTNVLTVAQKKALEADRGPGGRGGGFGGPGGPGGGRFGGPGPGGPGSRPDGPPPGGGRGGGREPGGPGGGMGGQRPTEAQMAGMRKMMATSNPLASPKMNPGFSMMPERMQSRMLDRFHDSEDFLKKLSQKAR